MILENTNLAVHHPALTIILWWQGLHVPESFLIVIPEHAVFQNGLKDPKTIAGRKHQDQNNNLGQPMMTAVTTNCFATVITISLLILCLFHPVRTYMTYMRIT